MPKRISGQRYAQAIFELASEHNLADEWAAQLNLASQVIQDAEFRAFLNHAEVPVADKIKSIEAVLPDIHPLIRNLLEVLVTRGLVNVAPELGEAYTKLLDQHHGRQRIEVISAVELEDAEVPLPPDGDAEETPRLTRFSQRNVKVYPHSVQCLSICVLKAASEEAVAVAGAPVVV